MTNVAKKNTVVADWLHVRHYFTNEEYKCSACGYIFKTHTECAPIWEYGKYNCPQCNALMNSPCEYYVAGVGYVYPKDEE